MPRGVKAQPGTTKGVKAPPLAKKVQPIAQQAEENPPVVQLVAPEFMAQPSFYRNKRVAVDAIEGDELKSYARSLGITQRDVDGLTPDRLRQNCKARIAESMSDD